MDSIERHYDLTWAEALEDLQAVIEYYDEQCGGCIPVCLEMSCQLIKEKIGGIKYET